MVLACQQARCVILTPIKFRPIIISPRTEKRGGYKSAAWVNVTLSVLLKCYE